MRRVYVLKVKGAQKIPDYIQIRDEQFTLIAYFRLERPERALRKAGLEAYQEYLVERIRQMPYGKVEAIELPPLGAST